MCDESAAKPKATKSRKSRKGGNGGGGGNASLVLLTTTGCKPCAAAKNYLQGQIDNGTVKVLDVQKDDFAADLAAKAKIVSVPKLLVLDAEGNPFSEIQITDQEQMI